MDLASSGGGLRANTTLSEAVCLPRRMAQRTLRRRLTDVQGVQQVLAEPLRLVTVGG
jgi:hypothetical protein